MSIRVCRFCLNYCVALVCTFLLVRLIGMLSGLSTGYASLLVLPLFVVATLEGKSFARLRRAQPRKRQSLAASLQMMVLALVVGTAFYILGRQFIPGVVSLLALPAIDNIWLAVAIISGGTLIVLRLGYAFGLASELKGQQSSG